MTEGILTRCDAQCQETYTHTPTGVVHSHQIAHARCALIDELAPVHSPLLGGSYSVSIPPLTNMLKFSGYSNLSSGLGWKSCQRQCHWIPYFRIPPHAPSRKSVRGVGILNRKS